MEFKSEISENKEDLFDEIQNTLGFELPLGSFNETNRATSIENDGLQIKKRRPKRFLSRFYK